MGLTTVHSPNTSLSIARRSCLPLILKRPLPQPAPQPPLSKLSQPPSMTRLRAQRAQLWPSLQLRLSLRLLPLQLAVAAALGSHVTVRGIPHRTADQSGAIAEQPQPIATLSRFGAVLMQRAAAVGENPGGDFAVQRHREPKVA